jgi:hypothetical protein
MDPTSLQRLLCNKINGTAFTSTNVKAFMIALEFKDPIEVTTPKGDGYIWYMIDYGPHSDTLYTIVIKQNGECWQMSHKDFRVKTNVSLGVKEDYQKDNLFNKKSGQQN